MAKEPIVPAGGDNGFTHESASVSFDAPPIDTTVAAVVEAAPLFFKEGLHFASGPFEFQAGRPEIAGVA